MTDKDTAEKRNLISAIILIILSLIILFVPLLYFIIFLFSLIRPDRHREILLEFALAIPSDFLISLLIGYLYIRRQNGKRNSIYNISFLPGNLQINKNEALTITDVKEIYIYCIKNKKAKEDYCFIKTKDSSYLLKWHSKIKQNRFIEIYGKYILQTSHEIREKAINVM